jgi:hypothetical protein
MQLHKYKIFKNRVPIKTIDSSDINNMINI